MQRSDARLFARFDLNEVADLVDKESGGCYKVTIVDIGLGGVQLRSQQLLPVDTKMVLGLSLPDGPTAKFVGSARYCNETQEHEAGKFTSGFKFYPETHKERVEIAEFVHAVFQRQWEILAS